MTYAWENFHMAIRSLAGLGTIQERLASAYNLHLIHVAPEELPPEVRELFKQVQEELTKAKAVENVTSVEATVSKMSDEVALDYVDKIITMIDAVARQEGEY